MDVVTFVSSRAKKRPPAVQGSTQLMEFGFQNSIALWTLLAALERQYQGSIKVLKPETTLREIEGFLGLLASPSEKPSAPTISQANLTQQPGTTTFQPAFFIGHDIEEISSLPETQDYRHHSFYERIFCSQEIARASLSPSPRTTLAGFFCAKEAIRKSHRQLLGVDLREIFIQHDAEGAPYVNLEHFGFSCQISISHTDAYASAVALSQHLPKGPSL